MLFWFALFFVAPIVEMYLLIRVGGYLGALPTIALVILTAVAGVMLVRSQGIATLTRGMSRLEGGQVPAREMAEGVLLGVAGVLLFVPGFVTDAVGVLLLVPPLRRAVARRMLARVVVRGGVGWTGSGPEAGAGGNRGSQPGDVIEGEFESRTEPEDDPPGSGSHDRRLR